MFGVVIALMKDIPDIHGDRVFNIRSFTVRFGQIRVFKNVTNLLSVLFGVFGGAFIRMSIMTSAGSAALRRGLVGVACWAAMWSVKKEARSINPEDSEEVYDYYMFLWKLFYLSYLVLPLAK